MSTNNSIQGLYLRVGMLIMMIFASILMYSFLPDVMPIHWGLNGNPDRFAKKEFALALIPLMTLAIIILFEIVPKLDPRKDKYQKFSKTWENIKTLMIFFFLYIYYVMIYVSVSGSDSISMFMMVGIGLLFVFLGNNLGKIRSNYFVGIRTPWTIENEEVWNKTQRMGGWSFCIAGFLLIIGGIFNLNPLFILIISLLLAGAWPVIYSFLIYKKSFTK